MNETLVLNGLTLLFLMFLLTHLKRFSDVFRGIKKEHGEEKGLRGLYSIFVTLENKIFQ